MPHDLKPVAGSASEAAHFLLRWEGEGGASSLPWKLATNHESLAHKLIAAARSIGDMQPDEIAGLLLQAAIRLKAPVQSDAKLEHIPVHAYYLLRQLSQRPVTMHSLHAADDRAAVEFLLTRGLAVKSEDKLMLQETDAGQVVGEIPTQP